MTFPKVQLQSALNCGTVCEQVKKAFQEMQFDWKLFENSEPMSILENYLVEAYIFLYVMFSK